MHRVSLQILQTLSSTTVIHQTDTHTSILHWQAASTALRLFGSKRTGYRKEILARTRQLAFQRVSLKEYLSPRIQVLYKDSVVQREIDCDQF